MPTIHSYFCPCPRGLEAALAEELQEIAGKSDTLHIHQTIPGGVHCSGMQHDGWLINLYSRIASRVLQRVEQSSYRHEEDIYRLAVKQHGKHGSVWKTRSVSISPQSVPH